MGVGSLSLVAFILVIIVGLVLLFAGVGGALAIALAYVPMLYLAQIFVGGWLGDIILGEKAGIGAQLGHLALGLLIVHGVALVPFLGVLASGVVMAWGAGALLLALYHRSRSIAAVPAAA